MKINKNSFLYKWAYADCRRQHPPTNLCQFARRVILMTITWLFIYNLLLLFFLFAPLFGFIMDFRCFTSHWRTKIPSPDKEKKFEPFHRWVPKIKGTPVSPILVSVVALILYGVVAGVVWLVLNVSSMTTNLLSQEPLISTRIAIWFFASTSCFGVAMVARFLWRETHEVVKAWWQAKKDRLCPIVEFVE